MVAEGWRFIHIPKTGGNAFRRAYGAGPAWMGGDRHLPSWFFADSVPHVTIVRNPYDRAVSLCAYLKRDELEREGRDLAVQEFDEWLRHGKANERAVICAGVTRTLRVGSPQVRWLDDREDVLRFERLQQDADAWARRVGIEPVELPRVHTSRHMPWELYYDAPLRRVVAERYTEDFHRLGYDQ